MLSSTRGLAAALLLSAFAGAGCEALLSAAVTRAENPKPASWDEPPPPDVPDLSDCQRQRDAWLKDHAGKAPPAELQCQPNGDYPGVGQPPGELPPGYYVEPGAGAPSGSPVAGAPSAAPTAAPTPPRDDTIVTP